VNVQVDGRLIKALRIKRSYSQERLAEIVGVNLRTIQRIETTGVASLGTRGSLAKAFGVRPDELDPPKAHAEPGGGLPRWPVLLLCSALTAVGWAVLAASIMRAAPIGLLTPQAIVGVCIALGGLFGLARITPLHPWRGYGVLSIYVVAIVVTPHPALTIQTLVTISLWAAFELGILLMRFRSPVAQ
jgi:DNA-binding XRE family transcriptional regulator